MPILVVIELPGGSAALDEALREAWQTTSDPPVGNRLRLAGPMENGWRVISLWDSREQFQEFMGQRLHLVLGDVGADEPKVTFWEIETVHSFE
jgi:hypothetical protein